MKSFICSTSAFKMALFAILILTFSKVFTQAVVSVDKLNILYRGLENPISVAVPGVDTNLVQLIATNAKLNKVNSEHYTIIPTGNSMEVSLRVFSVKGKDTTEYGNFHYRVFTVQPPELIIGGVLINDGTTISYSNLKANPYLMVELPNFLFDTKYTVTSYHIYFSEGGIDFEEEVKDNKISQLVLDKLEKIEKPVKVTISKVRAQGPNGIFPIKACSFLVN